MTRRAVHHLALAVAAAALLAGCVNAPVPSDGPLVPPSAGAPLGTAPPPGPVPGSEPAPADQRAADVDYAQAMLPHVAQGVELTTLARGRTADPELARLVQTVDHADTEEQGQLTGQLHLWRAPVPGERGEPSPRMPGMADAATLARLRTLSGPAFDRAWLAAMIAHHEGGVAMSRDYLARGDAQGLAGVAQAQVAVGGRQIDQMRVLQTRA